MEYLGLCILYKGDEQADLLTALLSRVGFEGFEQQEQQFWAYLPSEGFDMREEVEQLLTQHGFSWHWEQVKETNWNALWEASFSPVHMEGFCEIRADFHPRPEPGVLDVVITPKMSFGTGHHATTAGMLHALQTLEVSGKRVLDFGTGTGILAIVAEKLGAEQVLAIDNDAWALENCRENVIRNDCTHIRVQSYSEVSWERDSFDVVLANINRRVIESHWDLLQECLKPGGSMVLSGFLLQDREAMLGLCQASNCRTKGIHEENGWLVIQLVRAL